MILCSCKSKPLDGCPVGAKRGNHDVGSWVDNAGDLCAPPSPLNGLPSEPVQDLMGPQVVIKGNEEIEVNLIGHLGPECTVCHGGSVHACGHCEGTGVEPKYRRPGWDEYFLGFAKQASTRATCDRKHVGAVIVVNNRIIATGYNGSPKGMPHCDDVGHTMKEIDGRMSCIATLHAESNALDDAGRLSEGGTIYVTVTPCFRCAQRIVQHGIVRVVYGEYYQSQMTALVLGLFTQAKIELVSAAVLESSR